MKTLRSDELLSLAMPGFGPEHLPYGSFDAGSGARLGVRLGNHVLSVGEIIGQCPTTSDDLVEAVSYGDLTPVLALEATSWADLRALLSEVVTGARQMTVSAWSLNEIELRLPFTVADYVDCYASEAHASNLGTLFRPGQDALTANWKHLPIGYHGRAGTVIPSGRGVLRPAGLIGALVAATAALLAILTLGV